MKKEILELEFFCKLKILKYQIDFLKVIIIWKIKYFMYYNENNFIFLFVLKYGLTQ